MIVQNQTSPLAPVTSPSMDQLMNSYEQRAAGLRGEIQNNNTMPLSNPFKSDTGDQDAQQKAIAAREQLLAPIGANIYSPQADYTDAKHAQYVNNVDNDPAYKEMSGPLTEYLTTLKGAVSQGAISIDDAMKMFSDWGQENLNPILDKHHGSHSVTHKTTLHDIPEAAIPEIVKRAKGAK
ncbi:hypothetical protein L8P30_09945 [Enterobacter asburiae]|uniref:hypothetical protein n=1 Tax=Enterobacter asburiae TaxID=61645 RepID=UPI002004FEFD|nr:hypothetical protein [Enterobacter asburiae]MCK7142572.1 hypothetical protein [Enterobacter asburiae]